MPFFENEITHLIRQKEKRARVALAASAPGADVQAKAIARLSVDYPWLSPGVAVGLAKGNYAPDKAKAIALEDLRSQYEQNPAKFGDFKQGNARKRLKAWVNELDDYLDANAQGAAAPSAFDVVGATTNRGLRFQNITDDEVRALRNTARRALDSGDAVMMTAALGFINRRSRGGPDPLTTDRATGLTPQAEWIGQNVIDPLVNQTESVTKPVVRTAAMAAQYPLDIANAAIREEVSHPLGIGRSPEQNSYGYLNDQTLAGQALQGHPVGDGFLPSYAPVIDGQPSAAAIAAQKAREASRYLIGGHGWTPGRALAALVFDPDSTAFNVASGLVDAAVAIKIDPVSNVAAGFGRSARAAQTFENVNDAAGTVRGAEAVTSGLDEAGRVKMLEDIGVVNGRRAMVRGHNPVSWLYTNGAPVVTKLTTESDPWAIWNATNRKFPVDLVDQLANSTDEGLTRQILAGELGTTIDRVPKYREGYGIKPRALTDLPTGRLDLTDPDGAAHLIDDYLVLMKAPESTRAKVFNNLVRSAGRGDDYATVDAVFDAFRESMIAAGAPAEKADALAKWTRNTWDNAQKWGVDAATGDDLPVRLHLPATSESPAEVVEVPFGPRMPQERFSTTIDMPDPRAVKRLVASREFRDLGLGTDQWAGMVGITDKAYGAWKVFKLARPAWTVKVVGDEQARMMATGLSSILNHPIQSVLIALGNPQEGTFFGKSWYERIEGIGKQPNAKQIQDALDARSARATALLDENPYITSKEVRAILDEEIPIPRSVGQKASTALRSGKAKVGRLKTDVTGATVDARPGIGGDYAAGLTGRFTDFSSSGVEGRKMYLSHFDVAGRDSEHWARGLAEDAARLSSEPATRRAMRLTPQEFMDEMWEKPWGKYMREQMAAAREDGDPWIKVLNDRRYSDAYAQEFLRHLENFTADEESLRLALVTGKIDGVPLADEWGRANPAAMEKLEVMRAEGRGPSHVKVQRAVTQSISERERDIGKFTAAVNSLFDALMTRPSNYLSRHPTFMQKYWGDVPQLVPAMSADARAGLLSNLDAANLPRPLDAEVRTALAKATGTEGLDLEAADTILKKRALDFTRDKLYDLSKKSNIMDSLRFAFPFGEAFKEVLSVWGKIAVEYPQVTRRAQQGISAAQQAVFNPITGLPTGANDPMGTGFFRPDPQTGQQVFTLPGSGWLSQIATGGLTIPLKSPVQGLNMVGSLSPGFGFAVSIPASFIVPNKPGWDKVRKILFPFGQTETGDPLGIPGREFAPTWLKNLSKSFADPRQDRLYANTVMDIAAAKAATGEYDISGSPDSHDEINRLLHDSMKAADWAYAIRAFASATSPSAPGFDVYVKRHPDDENLILLQKLRDEYRSMVNEHGWDEGFKKFITKFGVDNLLATGSKSESHVAGLTTSTEQRRWARNNPALVEAYPETWALFAPEGSGHDQAAYEAQIASGQRDPVDPRTGTQKANDRMARAIVANAIETELGGSVDNAAERAYLRDLKTKLAREYDGYEPEFQGGGRTAARIRELERAATDPKLARTQTGKALVAYLAARDQANQIARDRGYSEVGAMDADKAAYLRDDLRRYVKKQLIPKAPAFRRMWETVLERELAD